MTTVTMLEIRKDPMRIIRQVQSGRRIVLTYRGKPAMRLEPIVNATMSEEDTFYRLSEKAVQGGKTLENNEIDETIYGAGNLR